MFKGKANDVVLVFLLLTYFTLFSSVSIVDFEQVDVSKVNAPISITSHNPN